MSGGDCWPEQEAVWAWMKRHGIELTIEQENDLKVSVSACRIQTQTELERLRAGHPATVGWKPIETAPMDGTAVLVMRDIWPGTASGRAEECTGHNTYVAEWWSEEGDSGKWVCYMDQVLDQVCPIVPTHWMPLPHPPSMLAASPEPVAPDTGGSWEEETHS